MLDLSWNQIRRKGAKAIAVGLAVRVCTQILVINFSWMIPLSLSPIFLVEQSISEGDELGVQWFCQ